ncbi:uncharacterized protein LOC101895347 [Musca domestica]|uniref:Uncharacterized protein LOC101895347 n=1 Tax=Musca domestica TaxID=7370 RepID=A0A1I8NGY5_MUSDO|nr:uncharacterized protein LOC101895347 [Musca domestica]
MRYQPQRNGKLCVELQPLWDFYHQPEDSKRTWKRPVFQSPHLINHWRDIDGAQLTKITHRDLTFPNWPQSRIRPSACLPLYYCTGYRFIRLTKDFPAGFKCPPVPLSFAEATAQRVHLRRMEREAERLAKQRAKEENRLKAENKKKKGNRK